MRKPVFLALGVALVALAVAAPASAKGVEVLVGKDDEASSTAYLRYFPDVVVVEAGDTVTWTAASNSPHTVTSDAEAFDSGPDLEDDPAMAAEFGPGGFLLPGQTFNTTFAAPGSVTYVCKIHPGMRGTVTVVVAPQGSLPGSGYVPKTVEVQAGGGSGDTSIDRFWPADITVNAGDTVEWTNVHSSEPHTVTAEGGTFDSSPNVGPPSETFSENVLWLSGPVTSFDHAFTEAGTYRYFCKLHPGMWGAVVVLPSGTVTESSPGPALPLALGTIALAALLIGRRARGPA